MENLFEWFFFSLFFSEVFLVLLCQQVYYQIKSRYFLALFIKKSKGKLHTASLKPICMQYIITLKFSGSIYLSYLIFAIFVLPVDLVNGRCVFTAIHFDHNSTHILNVRVYIRYVSLPLCAQRTKHEKYCGHFAEVVLENIRFLYILSQNYKKKIIKSYFESTCSF